MCCQFQIQVELKVPSEIPFFQAQQHQLPQLLLIGALDPSPALLLNDYWSCLAPFLFWELAGSQSSSSVNSTSSFLVTKWETTTSYS